MPQMGTRLEQKFFSKPLILASISASILLLQAFSPGKLWETPLWAHGMPLAQRSPLVCFPDIFVF
jgi:hypothetical protein